MAVIVNLSPNNLYQGPGESYNANRTPPQEQDPQGIYAFTYDATSYFRAWKFAKVAAAATATVGRVLWYTDTLRSVGTDDEDASGVGSRSNVLGVCTYTITAANFGWVQTKGSHLAIVSTGTINAGDFIVPSTTDGTVAGVAAGTAPTFLVMGICTVAAASNVAGGYLDLPL